MADKIGDSVVWNTLRDLLNKYGGKVVNTDTASAYDARGNVNFEARYKPVKWGDPLRQDSSTWWHATNGNCGVNVPILTSTSQLNGVTNPKSLWSHDYPSGSATEAFFSGDYRGYNPNARMVSGASVNPSGDVFISNIGGRSVCAISFLENLGTDALDYTEVQTQSGKMNLDDWYFGVIAIKTSGTTYGAVSLPYTMAGLNSVSADEYYAQDDHYAYVPLNGSDTSIFHLVGEYDIYPVLFYNKQDATNATSAITFANGYIPLPVEPIRINVVSPASYYSAEITSVSLSGNTLKINYTVSSSYGQLVFGPDTNTPTLEVRAYTDIAEGKEVFPYDGNTFGDFIKDYTVPSGGSYNCSDEVNILSPTGYKYLSVSIRWPQGFVATKMDIEL